MPWLHVGLNVIDWLATFLILACAGLIFWVSTLRTAHTTIHELRPTALWMCLVALSLAVFDILAILGELDHADLALWRKHFGRPLVALMCWSFAPWLVRKRQVTNQEREE